MTGCAPFSKLKYAPARYMQAVMAGYMPEPVDHPQLPASDPLWPIMRSCWQRNGRQRPSMDTVVAKVGMSGLITEATLIEMPPLPAADDNNSKIESLGSLALRSDSQRAGEPSIGALRRSAAPRPSEKRRPVLASLLVLPDRTLPRSTHRSPAPYPSIMSII